MYLKTQGVSPVGHPVQNELVNDPTYFPRLPLSLTPILIAHAPLQERIKGYIKKVKTISLEGEKRSQTEQQQLKLNQVPSCGRRHSGRHALLLGIPAPTVCPAMWFMTEHPDPFSSHPCIPATPPDLLTLHRRAQHHDSSCMR